MAVLQPNTVTRELTSAFAVGKDHFRYEWCRHQLNFVITDSGDLDPRFVKTCTSKDTEEFKLEDSARMLTTKRLVYTVPSVGKVLNRIKVSITVLIRSCNCKIN